MMKAEDSNAEYFYVIFMFDPNCDCYSSSWSKSVSNATALSGSEA
jgi:uncharacterized Fe-S center protein